MSGTDPAPAPSPMAAAAAAPLNELINTWGRVGVSGMILFMTFSAELLQYFKPGSVDAGMQDLLRTLSTIVAGHWLGSSAGSVTKTGQLATQTAMLAVSTPPPTGPTAAPGIPPNQLTAGGKP